MISPPSFVVSAPQFLNSGTQDAFKNMALDEALLDWVCAQAEPVFILRTYGWRLPSWSLGVNQPGTDVSGLLQMPPSPSHTAFTLSGFVEGGAESDQTGWQLVRRPTGGRAILHGDDVSFAFITNWPALLRMPLKESYCVFSAWTRETLEALSIDVHCGTGIGGRDYLRSASCFETFTPSDLLASTGEKLTGSAQKRRQGGLLQHGSAFLKPYEIGNDAFSEALAKRVADACGLERLSAFEISPALKGAVDRLAETRRQEARMIVESAFTTSGSHLEPASF